MNTFFYENYMKLHQLNGYLQSFYIAEYEKGLILLDGLSRPDIEILERYIKEDLSRNMKDLKLIICTHPHPDHAGAAYYLRDKYDIEIATHQDFNVWYKGLSGFIKHQIEIQLAHLSALLKGVKWKKLYYPRFIKTETLLKDGDVIPGFNDWSVIVTAGHTNCDISLYHKDTNQVYVGDLFIMLKNKASPPIPVTYTKTYKESLTKIIELDATRLLLAHKGIKSVKKETLIQLRDTFRDIPFNNFIRSLMIARSFLNRKIRRFFPRS